MCVTSQLVQLTLLATSAKEAATASTVQRATTSPVLAFVRQDSWASDVNQVGAQFLQHYPFQRVQDTQSIFITPSSALDCWILLAYVLYRLELFKLDVIYLCSRGKVLLPSADDC